MSRRAIFWGTLLLSIGSSILLIRAGMLPGSWEMIKSFWAVLLILAGLHVILRDTAGGIPLRVLLALLLGYGIATVVTDGHEFQWDGSTVHFRWHDEFGTSDDDQDDQSDDQRNTQSDSLKTSRDSSTTQPGGASHTDSTKHVQPVY